MKRHQSLTVDDWNRIAKVLRDCLFAQQSDGAASLSGADKAKSGRNRIVSTERNVKKPFHEIGL